MKLKKASPVRNTPKLTNTLPYLGTSAACLCHVILGVARSNLTVILSVPHSDAIVLALLKASATAVKVVGGRFI